MMANLNGSGGYWKRHPVHSSSIGASGGRTAASGKVRLTFSPPLGRLNVAARSNLPSRSFMSLSFGQATRVAARGHWGAAGVYVRDVAGGVEVLTPAKLNLFLEVLSRRDDGFHEIQSLIVPINLFDHLSFQKDSRGDLNLTCQWACGLEKRGRVIKPTQSPLPEWESLPEGKDNIAVRAVDLLRRRAGITAGASLQLIKRIPTAAGLGGGSSDAAAALVAANRAWKLDWPADRLSQMAAEVGSDVPFFLGATGFVRRARGTNSPSRGIRTARFCRGLSAGGFGDR